MTGNVDSITGSRGFLPMLAALPGFLGAVALFCVRFLAVHSGQVAFRLILPALVGWVMLYVLLSGYCDTLLAFLAHPAGGVASKVLGIVAAGFLIMLFLHAVVVAIVADLGLNGAGAVWSVRRIAPFAWRIYAANLRLVMMAGVVIVLLALAGRAVFVPLGLDDAFHFPILLIAFWLVVRGWFFVAPVCLVGPESGALQTVWRRSSGHAVPIAAILLAGFLVAVALQLAGEQLLRAGGLIANLHGAVDFVMVTQFYRENLLPLTIVFSFTYLVTVVILTVARVYAYQRLVAVVDTVTTS